MFPVSWRYHHGVRNSTGTFWVPTLSVLSYKQHDLERDVAELDENVQFFEENEGLASKEDDPLVQELKAALEKVTDTGVLLQLLFKSADTGTAA